MTTEKRIREALLHALKTPPAECRLIKSGKKPGCFVSKRGKNTDAISECFDSALLVEVEQEDTGSKKTPPVFVELTLQGLQHLVDSLDGSPGEEFMSLLETGHPYYLELLNEVGTAQIETWEDEKHQIYSEVNRNSLKLWFFQSQIIRTLLDQKTALLESLEETDARIETAVNQCAEFVQDVPEPDCIEAPPWQTPESPDDFDFVTTLCRQVISVWKNLNGDSASRRSLEDLLLNAGATPVGRRLERVEFDTALHRFPTPTGQNEIPDSVLVLNPGWTLKNNYGVILLAPADVVPAPADETPPEPELVDEDLPQTKLDDDCSGEVDRPPEPVDDSSVDPPADDGDEIPDETDPPSKQTGDPVEAVADDGGTDSTPAVTAETRSRDPEDPDTSQ